MTTFTYKRVRTADGCSYSAGNFTVNNGKIMLDHGFSLANANEIVLLTLGSLSYIGERSWTGVDLDSEFYVEIHRI